MTKIFEQWDTEDIEIQDEGLKEYVNLDTETPLHNQGTQREEAVGKKEINIVERLINTLMRGGTGGKISGVVIRGRGGTGKKTKMYNAVKEAFEEIEEETGKNPVEVLIRAIENSAPREETTRVERGGIARHEPVDVSPKRRVDFSMRKIGKSVAIESFKSPKSVSEALKDELLLASKGESDSYAVAQKINVERVAESSR